MSFTAAIEKLDAVRQKGVYRHSYSALLTDLYQLTMMYGYYKSGRMNQKAVFELFYRKNPCGNGFAIAAGLEQVVVFLTGLQFTAEDIDYLRSIQLFDEGFLEELRRFRFTGTVYAVEEGTVVFPSVPLLRFEGRIFELQLIESACLSFINHQTLIATKAARIVQATRGDMYDHLHQSVEFGLRRAQNADAATFGSRAAFIGGFAGTSNVYAGQNFGIPVVGTHSHSWIQSFPSELEAFRAYAATYPDRTTLLVDTYDTLKSGVPNAITVARELREKGRELLGVRLDSGDVAWLSKEVRRMLDAAGFPDVKILASGDLNEYVVRDMMLQGARVDIWCFGTALITGDDCPALGGVYKLVAKEEDGMMIPKIKVSENPEKITNPGYKRTVRLYLEDGTATADLIMLADEKLDPSQPLTLFHPIHTYKRKTIRNFKVEELLVPILQNGEIVYELPDLEQIKKRAESQLDSMPREIKRPINPHSYHVDLSEKLWELKQRLLKEARNGSI
ncbi:nicotinate phosphoribosyltransferase [Effusibacillus dendaii]|uniref:Nicotinate phosphoribosyltransferase n=1 Tax=Effusibacillus dendaii TaxID=2743772 RepID=A0A7I8DD69_9BACL|nr:nicotinate phosphoribosyltransferase [Effusibacillus dendaii]BCJ88045.1 nicotinate phosphoribosyltransferase [Effusibacillus dendaii]